MNAKKSFEIAHIDESDRLQGIRRRAYELYEARGREAGHELDDWLKAEAEIAPSKRKTTAA